MNKVEHYRDSEKNAKSFKKLIKIYPELEKNTGTVILPLNVDISDKAEKVALPIDLVKAALKKTTFIAGMNCCLCRQSNLCKDYPIDLGCLFLGESSRSVVKYGLAREFTYEEAMERVERAASLGLPAQSVWIEFEQPLWGVPNSEMDNFLEVCFCCPCCCIAMQLSSNLTEKERVRFHPSGWTAVADRTKCVGCGRCLTGPRTCPADAISLDENKKIVINQETCLGCGLCKTKCKLDVIKIKQTMPMRADIGEYFDEEFNVGLRIWKDEERNRELSSRS
jgi:Pyruvate/2-oxoacid:ferredoxin oxidoreductase delta subunit